MSADTLRGDLLGSVHLETQGVAKERERRTEVVDSDADVIQLRPHFAARARATKSRKHEITKSNYRLLSRLRVFVFCG